MNCGGSSCHATSHHREKISPVFVCCDPLGSRGAEPICRYNPSGRLPRYRKPQRTRTSASDTLAIPGECGSIARVKQPVVQPIHNLSNVTLIAIDAINQALALRALARSREGIRYARTLLLTDRLPADIAVPAGVEVVTIEPIVSRDAYSQFVLKRLLPFVATSHVLIVQWDGYVVNPAAWDPAFAACDYIGARWYWQPEGFRVGNGGFSLRSRRLLEALQDPRIVLTETEDLTIGHAFRTLLEREHDIAFADEPLADRFAFEAAHPIGKPFGFHGLFNFGRVIPAAELAALAPAFSDAIARSPQLAQLVKNAIAAGMGQAALALAERRLRALPDDADARALKDEAQRSSAQAPAAGRNEPCPCGSGKRYKHCHGAAGSSGLATTAEAPAATPDTLVQRALAAHRRGDLPAAEHDYRAALQALPQHPVALHYLGVIAYQRGDLAQALPLLEQAAALLPTEPDFHGNLGLALAASGRTDEAIAAYRSALARKPDHAAAWNNLGLALTAANALPAAIDALSQAVTLAPAFGEAHWNLALALLRHGDYARGWREYEWRLKLPAFHDASFPRTTPWMGNDLRGKTLLVVAEQGLGDTLHFIRFAALLAARGVRVVAAVPAGLAQLVATVPGVAAVATRAAPWPAHDAWIPLLSLPGVLGLLAPPAHAGVPYVFADDARRHAVAASLPSSAAALPRIGLAWAGAPANTLDSLRSCPLAALTPPLERTDVTWYSLQKGDGEAQIAGVPAAARLIASDARNDFDGTAALIANLDLVISVDTSIAHLAGALGRPVWILLPYACDWRWQDRRSDSPWYPSARLFRQSRPGDWASVVNAVGAALDARGRE